MLSCFSRSRVDLGKNLGWLRPRFRKTTLMRVAIVDQFQNPQRLPAVYFWLLLPSNAPHEIVQLSIEAVAWDTAAPRQTNSLADRPSTQTAVQDDRCGICSQGFRCSD